MQKSAGPGTLTTFEPPPLPEPLRSAWRHWLVWGLGCGLLVLVWFAVSDGLFGRASARHLFPRLGLQAVDLVFAVLSAAAAGVLMGHARWRLAVQTRQSQAQASQASASDERWRQLMQSLSEVAWFSDARGQRVLYVSPATRAVYGREPQAFYDDPDLWLKLVHPDDQERVRSISSQLALTRTPRELEYRIQHADGSVRWLRDRASALVGADGQLLGIAGVAEDITERRLAEARQHQRELQLGGILDSAMDAIITVDAAQRVRLFNKAAGLTFGVDPERMIGEPLERFLPARLQDAHRQHVEDFARTGSTSRRMGLRHDLVALHADGREFPIEATISRLVDGDTPLMTVVLRDVSEARAADAAVQAQRAAEAASRAKSGFLSRMSHEMRTPLNAVLGFTQLLQTSGQSLNERQRSQIDHIRQAGWHLLALINDVLDVSRIESGAMQVQLQPLDARLVVDDMLRLCEAQAQRQGVRLRAPAAGVATFLTADDTRLRQVLLNVLSNAIKYNRPGGQVDVRLGVSAGRVLIEVADTGLGMSRQQLDRLYEPFNRLGREKAGIEGTGIGLTLTRELVLLMNGSIDVDSEEGVGTTLSLSFPAAHRPDPGDTDPLDAPGTVPGGLDDDLRGTVLYVEDNPVNRLVVEQLLSPWPHLHLAMAEDCVGGLAMAALLQPDLVLLDMRLPDGDGLSFLRRLKADPHTAGLRVVALSASAMPEEVAAARAAGAVAYWTKPLDFDRFQDDLRAFLARPEGAAAAVATAG